MSSVLIVSIGRYPNGNAGAIRQHAFAKLFELCGYTPYVIGMGPSTNFQSKTFEGVRYTSFRANKNHLFNRILNLFLFKARLKKFLKENNKFSKIVVVSIPQPALFYLKRYAKKEEIQLIHDSVEWYSPEEFSLGKVSPSYFINNCYNTKWIDKNFKVIAISKYLQKHFQSRKIDTVRIPVIMDVNKLPHKKQIKVDKLVLMYAGAAGKKDYLKEIIEGLSLLKNKDLSKLELRIFGVEEEQLKIDMNISNHTIEKLSSTLKCFGRVSREVVLKNLEEADFTVLLRSSTQRYAKAGFPTKVVESLSSATPVICNITSDLGDYIEDTVNGIVVEECTPDSFAFSVKRAMEFSIDERLQMCANARKTAEESFDYSKYINIANEL